jgi:flagellar biosynthesis protein FlhG
MEVSANRESSGALYDPDAAACACLFSDDPANGSVLPHTSTHPVIIAIGGATGSVGKSIVASNLSVYLTQKGYTVMAADLDPQDAGLHVFLGKAGLQHSINDFLGDKVAHIHQIIEATTHGPLLIGGGSSRLEGPHFSFTRKLMLLKALRKANTDFVILDLGSSTCGHLLDFFLAADLKMVMTTCEPASVLEACAFIKAALYRKLDLLYGPHTLMPGRGDSLLQRLIAETAVCGDNPIAGDIEKLIQRIKKEHPLSLNTIHHALFKFQPRLFVNKSGSEEKARETAQQIREMTKRKLAIGVSYMGCLPYLDRIEKSARNGVPWVCEDMGTVLKRQIDHIVRQLEALQPEVQAA